MGGNKQAAAVSVIADKVPDAEDPKAPPIEARSDSKSEKKRFNVTFGNVTKTIDARDANEARALFNDANKSWPSPKAVQVVEVAG
jgi:hypothetical protein